mgnify:CR=1 FL=1
MVCYKPISAFRSLHHKTANGKSVISFDKVKLGDHTQEEICLPCGRCLGCRIERSKSWALRCMHEASLHLDNCFITLTYNDDNLNTKGSLVKADFQKFMKR